MELIAALLAAKLVDRASASDDYQIIVLAFLHLIAATVAMDGLLFGGCFLGFTACTVPALAMTHLRQEMESRFGQGSKQPDAGRVLERLFGSKRVITPGFLIGSSLLSLPVLLLTGLLFILFPRFGLGFMGRLRSSEQTVGFGDSISLSDTDISNLEDTIVIRLEPVTAILSTPSKLPIRLRAAALETFDGNTWARNKKPKWRPIDFTDRGYVVNRVESKNFYELDVMLDSMQPPLLALPEGTGWIVPDPAANRPGNSQPRLLVMNEAGEIEYEDPAEAGIHYRAVIVGAEPPGEPPSLHSNTLKLFPGAERLKQTARESAGAGPARDRAERLVRVLQTEYRYSLTVADNRQNNLENTSLNRFLYARKTGSCEHFATALTLMLRAVGIPARLITGFSGADWNPIGGFYAVRQRYAHAWTEAFIEGRWLTLDATPSAPDAAIGGAGNFVAMLLETLQMQWRKRVVGYDLGTQGKLVFGLMRKMRGFQGENSIFGGYQILAWLVPSALLAGLAVLLVVRFRRIQPALGHKRIAANRAESGLRDAAKLYQVLERQLSRLGYPRPSHMTPKEHLDTIQKSLPVFWEEAARITRRYNEVRFGRAMLADGELKNLLQSAKRLGQNVAGRSH